MIAADSFVNLSYIEYSKAYQQLCCLSPICLCVVLCRCIDNTDGFNCERCKSGFFGDALALKKPGDPPSCQPCQCYPIGTNLNEDNFLPICNGYTGDCSCKSNVVGRDCDTCADGYFNLDSGQVELGIFFLKKVTACIRSN